jgi:hypothetical protein
VVVVCFLGEDLEKATWPLLSTVDFFASWCAHYKKLTSILKKATSLLKGVRKELMAMPCSLLVRSTSTGDRRQTQVKFFHFFLLL